ncbi:trigger factor [Candidatus Falkowbacteria bacterium]|jgi:trigger factor|nr:trigger factor [Candidatus Falkowbacteria bacterium]
MNITKKELGKNELELTIEISHDELKPFLESSVEEISKSKAIAGFRPGKAPYDVVVKEVGEMPIYQSAANDAIAKYYYEAITKEGLDPVDQPKVETIKLAPNNPFIFKATIALLPKIEIADLEKLSVKPVEEVKVEEKEIEKTLEQIKNMRAKETLQDKAAEKEDKIDLSFEGFMDNVPVEGAKAEKHSLIIGKGQMIPGFEDNLIGLKKDEDKEFELTFPKDYHDKKLQDKKITFKVKVLAVYKMELPELNDELAKGFGFKDLAGLKGNITNNIKTEKENKAKQKKELEIIELILEKSKFEDIPEVMITNETHKMVHEMEDNLTKQGMNMKDYLTHLKKTEAELRLDFVPDALKRIKTGLVIRQIAIDKKMEATEEEIKAEKEKTIAQYKLNPQTAEQVPELEKQMETENATRYFENLIANRKTIEYIKNEVIAK